MKGQRQAILEHLQTKGSITQKECTELYGAMRLPAIICDFRKMGYNIITMTQVCKTRFGTTSQYAKYVYRGKKEN